MLKTLLKLDDTYDVAMTEIFYKSGLKGANSYAEGDWQRQCNCETNETKSGTVLDCFAAVVRQALLLIILIEIQS